MISLIHQSHSGPIGDLLERNIITVIIIKDRAAAGGGRGSTFFGASYVLSWESKVPPPKLPPPRNKALLRDY